MLRMVVSGSQTGSLIGKGGSKINNIREKSGASIRVIEDAHPSCCQGDRIIFVGVLVLSTCIAIFGFVDKVLYFVVAGSWRNIQREGCSADDR